MDNQKKNHLELNAKRKTSFQRMSKAQYLNHGDYAYITWDFAKLLTFLQ